MQLTLLAFGHPAQFFHSPLSAWQYEHARDLYRESGIDLIAMGNSQIHVGFDATLFSQLSGMESFNFSLDGADAIAQAAYLREIVVPSFRPKRVVWGLSPRDLNANPAYREHTNHRRILESPALRTASLPGGWRLIPLAKDLLPFHKRSWDDWCRVYWHWASRKPPTLDARGWRARTGRYEPGPFEQARAGYYYEAEFSPRWLDALYATFAGMRASGIDLWVVTAPVHRNALGMFDPQKLEQALGYLETTSRDAGVPYLDWLEHEQFADAALYHDAIHLNTHGAERLTRLLAEAISHPAGPLQRTAARR